MSKSIGNNEPIQVCEQNNRNDLNNIDSKCGDLVYILNDEKTGKDGAIFRRIRKKKQNEFCARYFPHINQFRSYDRFAFAVIRSVIHLLFSQSMRTIHSQSILIYK